MPSFRAKKVRLIKSKRGQKNWYQGKIAEWIAQCLLRLKGYTLIHKRYKTPLGEIDIIAQRGKLLLFVEVKKRFSLTQSAESITYAQQSRICRAASLFLKKTPFHGQKRFDILLLNRFYFPKHIKGAWVEKSDYFS